MTLLGSVVYLRNRRSAMGRYFFMLCLATALWACFHYLVDHASSLAASLLYAQISAAAALNVIFWMVLFSASFRRSKALAWRRWPILTVVWLLGMGFSVSSLVYNSASQGQEIVNVGTGEGYLLYLVLLVGGFAMVVRQLLVARQHNSARTRSQIDFILLGICLTFGLAIVNNGIIPLLVDDWYGVKTVSILAMFFVISVSYAIIRHKLFDMRLLAARSVAYILVLLTMGGIYSLVVFSLVDRMFTASQIDLVQRLVYMLAAMLLAFTFQPLKRFFDRVTDRVFFRSRYSLEDLVADVTNHTASTLDLTLLAERTLRRVTDGMRVERASLWAVEEGDFYCAAYRNMELSDLERVEPELLLDMVGEVKHSVIVAEEVGGRFGRCLHRWQVEIAVPLLASGSLQGVILLGNKQSGDMYTDQDINALRIIGPSLAIGLENAASYKRIQEFNQTLAQEVDKATYELTVANEKLSRSNAKLRQLDSLKDEFISITSHELRTPLTAIRGYLWMAMHREESGAKGKGQGVESQYLERAYISTERLIDLVNDSLDISRLDSGRVQLTPEPTDLGRLVEEVTTDLRPRVEQQRQRLVIVKPKVALPAVMVDPEKLYQVLTNLVGNAIKFTPDGGEIRVSFERQKGGVVTRIADTGPGISAEDQKRLFQKFSRLDAAATIPGTGLGLFLCREIIRLSKGKIWVESEVGQGTAFVFSLPATRRKATSPDGQKRHAQRLISAAAR